MFLKQGTPQPIKIATGMCEVCGKEHATSLVDGQMICNSCKERKASSKED